MKVNTNTLTGPALDWAVHQAWCEGACDDEPHPSYSNDWSQGGPIIERECITVGPYHNGEDGKPTGTFQAYLGWDAEAYESLFEQSGPTPLIAACRCFVASKRGEEVEVPDELT